MTKVITNEKGELTLTLPVSGIKAKLRSPKGRDMKALEIASKQPDATNVGMMMVLASMLLVEPQMTSEEVEDLDTEDVEALGVALGNFRAFRKA